MTRFATALLILFACSSSAARSVRITGAGGSPVPGARAWVTLPDAVREIDIDASGIAQLPDAVPDAACVTAPGHRPVALAADAGEVTLVKGEPLVGSVLAAGTKLPVAGAIVRLAGDESFGPCARQAVAGAKGEWSLGGLPRGVQSFEIVEAAGCLLPPAQSAATGAGRRLDVLVHRSSVLTLAVTGPDGKPVASVPVRIEGRWTARRLEPAAWPALRKSIDEWRGATSATGTVTLPALPMREGWRVVAEPAGLAPASVLADAKQPRQDVRLALGAGAAITARAIDENGAPIAGAIARVVAIDGADLDLAAPSPPAAADGRVRLSRVPPGRLVVFVSASGMRPTTSAPLSSRHGATIALGDVPLRPGVALTGVVQSPSAPIAGATVAVTGQSDEGAVKAALTTDAAGSFVLDALDPEARLKLVVKAEGHLARTLERVVPGGERIEVTLEPAATVVVEARSALSQEPLTDVGILISREGRGLRGEPPRRREDAGDFVVSGLAPGPADVVVSAPGHARARRSVTLLPGEETLVSVTLDEGRSIAGRVIEAGTERPVSGATVTAPTLSSSARTGLDGTFVLDGFDAPALVRVEHPSFQRMTLPPVDPDALPAEGLVVPMTRGAAVEGTVFGAGGAPLPGAVVSAESDGKSAVSDASGAYRLDGLAPGTSLLEKLDAPGRVEGRETARVELTAGSVARVDFGSGARVHGRITQSGEPLRDVQVGLLKVPSEDGDPATAFMLPSAVGVSDADGSYELTGVVEGLHAMQLSWGDRQAARDVTVPPGARDVPLDVEIPDLRLAGLVVETGSGEPVADAYVSAFRPIEDGRAQMNMSLGVATAEGESSDVSLTTTNESRDATGPDGRFLLRLFQPGTYKVICYAGEGRVAQQDVQVTASRDDLVLEIPPDDAGKTHRLRIRLFDARTGAALSGTISSAGKRGSTTNTDASEHSAQIVPEDLPMTVAAWVPGYAVATSQVTSGDEDVSLDLRLSPGGSLRLGVPAGALTAGTLCNEEPKLSLQLASGFDLVRGNTMICVNTTGRLVTPEGDAGIVVRDLPAGPLTVRLGDGPPHVVEILPGDVADLQLP